MLFRSKGRGHLASGLLQKADHITYQQWIHPVLIFGSMNMSFQLPLKHTGWISQTPLCFQKETRPTGLYENPLMSLTLVICEGLQEAKTIAMLYDPAHGAFLCSAKPQGQNFLIHYLNPFLPKSQFGADSLNVYLKTFILLFLHCSYKSRFVLLLVFHNNNVERKGTRAHFLEMYSASSQILSWPHPTWHV